MKDDDGNSISPSIYKFWQLYENRAVHIRGIGNAEDYSNGLRATTELAFAFEAAERTASAYDELVEFYQDPQNRENVPLDIIGYSRGAFQAAKLAEMIAEHGIPNLQSRTVGGKEHLITKDGKIHLRGIVMTPFDDQPHIRFIGLLSPSGRWARPRSSTS